MSNESLIPFHEITFVIQGLVTPLVNQSIAQIREIFPGASVIVSTCNEIGIDIVGADQIVQSDDPGALYYQKTKTGCLNNINRQLLSTIAGLRLVTTKYAFKLRSDFLMTGSSFLDYLCRFQESDSAYRIFNRKVLACCYFSRNPVSCDSYPFHISDLAFFGETSQLVDIFDSPLLTNENAYVSRVIARKNVVVSQYMPEQYLMISWLRRNGHNVSCEHYEDATPANSELTGRYLASNFILLSFEQFCLKPTKDTFSMSLFPASFRSCYTHVEWQRLYRDYVNNEHNPPIEDAERKQISRLLKRNRKYRMLANICAAVFFDSQKRKDVRRRLMAIFLER